ncbi:MAG TPA: PPC domain-containing DNA-binding protein [Candidatus Saccharimonadales bacterium]|nr:PPC domain-containing DNA-binding protein [Candidatus Saccharimonadales bacterium]
MQYLYDGYNYTVGFERGEQLITSLTDFIKKQDIKASWINGLGGSQWVELGFYNLDTKEYQWKRFNELMEITSLQGNIAWMENEPVIHMHGTLSREDYQAIGGHVRELEVGGTCELHLHTIFGDRLPRSKDATTGLSLLSLPN